MMTNEMSDIANLSQYIDEAWNYQYDVSGTCVNDSQVLFAQHELLAAEKELLGFYVTGHPLTPYAPLLEKYTLTNTAKLAELPNRALTRIGGLIAAIQNGISKKNGKPYSLVTLEDLEGSVQ